MSRALAAKPWFLVSAALLLRGATLSAQCLPIAPATFLTSTERCNPSTTEPTFEASGAVFHPRRGELLVVGDEGDIVGFDPATGALRSRWCLPGDRDLEAICVADFGSDIAYVLDEEESRVLEFDLASGTFRRSFQLTRLNSSFEAMTFVPDPAHPHGGQFWVGVQTTGRIAVYDLPIRHSTATTATLARTIDVAPPPWIADFDFRGFDFDRDRGVLYAISRTDHLIVAIDTAGNFLRCWPATRRAAHEGLALVGCSLWSAIDTGQWSFEIHADFPGPAGCPTLSASASTISASSGGAMALRIDATPSAAGWPFVVTGSLRGNHPGMDIGALHVPLNPDFYTCALLSGPNPTGAFAIRNVGSLDRNGVADVPLRVPPLVPALIGQTLHHAAIRFDPATGAAFASNTHALHLTR